MEIGNACQDENGICYVLIEIISAKIKKNKETKRTIIENRMEELLIGSQKVHFKMTLHMRNDVKNKKVRRKGLHFLSNLLILF